MKHFDDELNGNATSTAATRIHINMICGADLLKSFCDPGVWDEKDLHIILGRYGLLVTERGDLSVMALVYSNHLLWSYERNIGVVHQFIVNGTSSTALRACIMRGQSIKYLTPDPVIAYILKEGLYAAPRPQL